MRKYSNKSGDSGVAAYETGKTYILVRFVGGPTYKYSYKSCGKEKVEHMKRLATAGLGLSTYISRYARDCYEEQLD